MKISVITLILFCTLLTACVQPRTFTPQAERVASTELAFQIDIPEIPNTIDARKNDALKNYLDEVVSKNKDLNSIASTIQIFELEEEIVSAESLPKASGDISKQKNEKSQEEKDFGFAKEEEVNASINASWAVDVWGRLADQSKASEIQSEQKELEYQHARRVLVAQAAQTWLALWRVQNRIQYTEQRAETSQRLMKTIEDYYLNGEADYESVSQQRTSAIQIQEELVQLKAEQQIHRHRFNVLRGNSPRKTIVLYDYDIQPVITQLPNEITAVTLQNRPDILSSFKQIEILDTHTRASYKALLPQLKITGALSGDSQTIADVFSGDILWQLEGGITHVLFDSSQLRNQAKQKSKEAETSLYKYEQVVLDAMEEVENTLANEKALSTQMLLTQKRLSESKHLVNSKVEAYKDGSMSVFQLLQAEEQFLRIKNEWIDIQSNYLKNRITLALATGQSLEIKEK